MPYKVVKVKGGYKVQNIDSGRFFSNYALTLTQAKKQLLALLISSSK
jgi:hypothetical protein